MIAPGSVRNGIQVAVHEGPHGPAGDEEKRWPRAAIDGVAWMALDVEDAGLNGDESTSNHGSLVQSRDVGTDSSLALDTNNGLRRVRIAQGRRVGTRRPASSGAAVERL